MQLACEGVWDVSNHNMYDLAYKWTHQHTLKDWKYVRLQDPACVQLGYLTQIQLAPTFQQFVPSQVLRSSMVKKVCVSDNVLQETLVLRNIILIDTLQIDMNATIHSDTHTFGNSSVNGSPELQQKNKLLLAPLSKYRAADRTASCMLRRIDQL